MYLVIVFRMRAPYFGQPGLYPPNPPYFQGRYSNGRVWVEYLADRLNLSSNKTNYFACGGATTGNDGGSLGDNPYLKGLIPSLLAQVQSFTTTNKQVNQDGLYVVWAGANDYLQGINNVAVPIGNVTNAIQSLINVGAKKFWLQTYPIWGSYLQHGTRPVPQH